MTIEAWSELYICLILTVEFVYDYWWNSRENRKKRRAKKETRLEDKSLTIGEMK